MELVPEIKDDTKPAIIFMAWLQTGSRLFMSPQIPPGLQ